MRKPKAAFIQIACGFKKQPKLGCKPTEADEALSIVDVDRGNLLLQEVRVHAVCYGVEFTEVWFTGRVAYLPRRETPALTLANINSWRFWKNAKTSYIDIRCELVEGLTPFSETWAAEKLIRQGQIDKIVVVASAFYLVAYERLWRSVARRTGAMIEFAIADHEEGVVAEEVWDFYSSFQPQLLSSLAATCRFGHWLAKTLADWKTRDRVTHGWRKDGHSKIV